MYLCINQNLFLIYTKDQKKYFLVKFEIFLCAEDSIVKINRKKFKTCFRWIQVFGQQYLYLISSSNKLPWTQFPCADGKVNFCEASSFLLQYILSSVNCLLSVQYISSFIVFFLNFISTISKISLVKCKYTSSYYYVIYISFLTGKLTGLYVQLQFSSSKVFVHWTFCGTC